MPTKRNIPANWGDHDIDLRWYIKLPNGEWLSKWNAPKGFDKHVDAIAEVIELVQQARQLGCADYRPEIFVQEVETIFRTPAYDSARNAELDKIVGEG